jgi:fibronectin-binding autotransporter adhesin
MKLKITSFAALSAMSFAGSASAAEIAGGNGSFETVTLNAPETFTNAWLLTNVTISGWTYTERTPDVNGAVWFMGGNTYGTASNGNYMVNLISAGTSYFLSTSITGLTAGNSYTVYFDARQRDGGGGNFDVVVDTTVPTGGFNITPTSTAWAQQSITFTANAPTHTLQIANYDYDANTATATGAGLMVDNFSVVPVLSDADGIWTGTDGNWSDATKWDASTIAQGIDKTATFNGLSPVIATVDSSRSIGALSFSGANHTIAAGAGNLTLDVTAPAVPTVTVANGITATIGALLTGNDGMAKTGLGTLTLNGTNTYTGGTAVNDGTLKLELGGRAGTESFSGSFSVASGATLNLDNTNTTVGGYYPSSFVLSGAGTLTKTNSGSIDLWTGSSLTGFTGTMDVQQGALRLNNITTGADMPQATLNIASGATFDVRFNASLSVDKLTGSGTLDQSYDGGSGLTVTVGSNNGSSTFDGVIQNSSGQPLSLTKAGSGTLTLTGANTYTGTTTVSEGILSLSSPMINDLASVVIDNGATMNLNFVGNDTVGSLDIDG